VLAEEDVVEGPACERVLSMEHREEATSLAGIEQATKILEKPVGTR
jgi:hypothetical protein